MAVFKKPLCLVVISFVAISSWAFAAGPHGYSADCPKEPKGLFKILHEDQQEVVKAMLEEHREEMKRLHEEMENLREELHELVMAEAGEVELDAKIDEIGALRTEIMKKRVHFHVEVRKLLTDEQKLQLEELKGEMGPYGHMGGPGEGKRHEGGYGPGGRWTEPDEPNE
jgi:Spy/CpxP family protein refolding chaperone